VWERRGPGPRQVLQNELQGLDRWALPSSHFQTRHTESSKKASGAFLSGPGAYLLQRIKVSAEVGGERGAFVSQIAVKKCF
jgi:hypothetical protein